MMKKNQQKDFLLRYATLAVTAGMTAAMPLAVGAQDDASPKLNNPQGIQIRGDTSVAAVYGPPPGGNVAKNAAGAIKKGTIIQGNHRYTRPLPENVEENPPAGSDTAKPKP